MSKLNLLAQVTRLVLAAALLVGVTLTVAPAPRAYAATITVTTTNDELNNDGDCSLREAIRAANTNGAMDACPAGSGADTINLPSGTYTLSITGMNEEAGLTGDLDIASGLTLAGAGTTSTIVDGNGIDRVFDITGAYVVNFSNVTVRNGNVGSGANGGGFYNYGTLTLNNVIVSNNHAHDGGGLINVGIAVLANSKVIDNTVSDSGGGIRNDITMTISNSFVGNNIASAFGGGVSNGGTLTIIDSTINNNTAITFGGGGIYNYGILTVNNSTVGANSGSDYGGGINNVSSLTLNNSTVSGNTISARGGGIYNALLSFSMALNNSTISDNSASQGGGIYNDRVGTLRNTIVANSISGGDCFSNNSQSILNNISSIIEDNSCGFTGGSDPLLGPLADNGGPTQTHALLPDSPAIDAGNNVTCTTTDQRGVARPVDGDQNGSAVCDIGAYEYNPPLAAFVLLLPVNNSLVTNYTPTLDWSDATPLADHYQIQINDNNNFSPPTIDQTATPSTFTPGAPLNPATTYYWRVRAFDAIGQASKWSTVYSFRTAVPPPTPDFPNMVSQPQSLRPFFDWDTVTTASSYNLQISTDRNFTMLLADLGVSSPAHILTADLPRGTSLYWRVRSNNQGGYGPSAWSVVKSFDTPNPPSVPMLITPQGGTTVASFTPLLDWNDSSPTPQRYEVQIATDNGFVNVLGRGQNGGTSQSQYTPETPLAMNTTYYWRVRAFGGNSPSGQLLFSEWSGMGSFKTP